MKSRVFQTLGLATCAVALVTVIGFAVDLASIVANEPVKEINEAAGLNLIDDYISAYSVEQLTDLAAHGATPGIRLAADRALFELSGGLLTLVVLDQDTLYAMAAAGDQDAADAWVFNVRASYKRPDAVEAALPAQEVETIQIALGKLLGGFYGPGSPIGQKPKEELLRLVVQGDNLGLRVAAATALTTYWIEEARLTIAQAERAIRANSGINLELTLAHRNLLAYLYGQ